MLITMLFFRSLAGLKSRKMNKQFPRIKKYTLDINGKWYEGEINNYKIGKNHVEQLKHIQENFVE